MTSSNTKKSLLIPLPLLISLPFALLAILLTFQSHQVQFSTISNSISVHSDISSSILYKNFLNSSNLFKEYSSECVFHNKITGEKWFIYNNNIHEWSMFELMNYQGFVNIKHIHPYQLEAIHLLNNSVNLLLENKIITIKENQLVVVPGKTKKTNSMG
jgi:hypothetical protein